MNLTSSVICASSREWWLGKRYIVRFGTCLTALAVGSVLLAMDIYGNIASNLVSHVVDGAGYDVRADTAGDAACKTDRDGVCVWDPGNVCQDGVSDPQASRRR
jgi:hypothetical protein